MSIYNLRKLHERKLVTPPSWLVDNTLYETVMGSVAYGVSNDTSDLDIYGFCIPPKENVFPHLAREIHGFGWQIQRFEQYQQHHIDDPSAMAGKGRVYDVTIFSIIKYFQLCMENNPNALDSLFTPVSCVITLSQIAQLVRERRREFLHKGSWHRFKGYAYSQLHKMDNKEPIGKRKETVEKFGFDLKFAYHVVRLMLQAEQILVEGDIDLQRNAELLKSIRRGEWTQEEIKKYFSEKEATLDKVYAESKVPHSPPEDKIKQLLVDCLESHYGDLKNAVVIPDRYKNCVLEIKSVLDRYGY